MCQRCKPSGCRRIDKCMRVICAMSTHKVLASCCGHGKYPPSIVCIDDEGKIFEQISNTDIPRTRNFYKKNKQGIYFIPEALEGGNSND